ncbi:MAG: hypothetical protein WC682_01230 [Parcubacteria group bacterium]|jgi:RsiW-degrading membrane proteinase PrsW (M82 family)
MNFRNAIQSLFWGIITAGMSLVLQLIILSLLLSQNSSDKITSVLMSSLTFLIIYALTEESFKYFIVSKKILSLSYGKGFMINTWIAGIGFALVEIFIIYQKYTYNKIDFNLSDLLATAPLHILTFGILGYFLSTTHKKGPNVSVLFFNFIIHLSYNYFRIYLENYSQYTSAGIIFLLFIVNIYGLLAVNKKLASD